MCDTLFDEKINGSFHLTPGMALEESDNGNRSAIHWDIVKILREEFGGGEVYFDDMLIMKDGRFVLDKLKPLGQTGTNELYYSLDYIIANNIFAASETDSQGNKIFLNPITNDKLYGCIKVTYDVNKFEVKTEFIDKNNQAEMDNCKG